MAMTWEEYQSAYPAPYDLEAFTNQANQQYADLQYWQRPQEWHDEYEMMRRANLEWQANYYNGGYAGGGAGNIASLNPFINSGGQNAYYTYAGTAEDPYAYNVEYIGEPAPQTDWYAEAAAGNPVIGPAVQPNQTASSYYGSNPGVTPTPGVPTQLGVPNSPAYVPPNYQQQGGLGQTTIPQNLQPAYNAGTGQSDLQQLASNLPKGTPTNVYNGGTISNFWDNQGQSQGALTPGSQAQDLNSTLSKWFKDTYGSGYGMP